MTDLKGDVRVEFFALDVESYGDLDAKLKEAFLLLGYEVECVTMSGPYEDYVPKFPPYQRPADAVTPGDKVVYDSVVRGISQGNQEEKLPKQRWHLEGASFSLGCIATVAGIVLGLLLGQWMVGG